MASATSTSRKCLSVWKLECILADHPGFVATLARLLRVGHRVVITIGNHDRELWFTEVATCVRTHIEAACAAVPGSGALVAREQFLPGLRQEGTTYRACWEPILTGAEAGRLAQLARAMPHACRALGRFAIGQSQTPSTEEIES